MSVCVQRHSCDGHTIRAWGCLHAKDGNTAPSTHLELKLCFVMRLTLERARNPFFVGPPFLYPALNSQPSSSPQQLSILWSPLTPSSAFRNIRHTYSGGELPVLHSWPASASHGLIYWRFRRCEWSAQSVAPETRTKLTVIMSHSDELLSEARQG